MFPLINRFSVIWKYKVLAFGLGGTELFPIMAVYRKLERVGKADDFGMGFEIVLY
jgi:hypothetical protein